MVSLKSFAAGAGLALTCVGPALAEPLWNRFPVLECQGQQIVHCRLDDLTCRNSTSSARWRVDFRAQEVRYLTIDFSKQIVATHYHDYGSDIGETNVALLSSGRMAVFEAPGVRDGVEQVQMTTLDLDGGAQVDSTVFWCTAPGAAPRPPAAAAKSAG